MRELANSDNRTKIMAAIRSFWSDNGYAPDIRDVMRLAGIPQTTTYYHLKQLEKMGKILWNTRDGNSIRLAGTKIILPE